MYYKTHPCDEIYKKKGGGCKRNERCAFFHDKKFKRAAKYEFMGETSSNDNSLKEGKGDGSEYSNSLDAKEFLEEKKDSSPIVSLNY